MDWRSYAAQLHESQGDAKFATLRLIILSKSLVVNIQTISFPIIVFVCHPIIPRSILALRYFLKDIYSGTVTTTFASSQSHSCDLRNQIRHSIRHSIKRNLNMFALRTAAQRAVSVVPAAISASRVTTRRVVLLRSPIASPTIRSFVQCTPRWAIPSGQEEAATSESTDAVELEGQEAAASPSSQPTSPPSGRSSGAGVYVGNLPFTVTEESLRPTFARFGEITRLTVIRDADGRSKGFGFVEFSNKQAAVEAAEQCNDSDMEGRVMRVRVTDQYSRPNHKSARKVPNPPSNSLFIGNLSFQMTDKELNDLFRDIKNVVDVRVAIDRRTGQPRGFAHADFTDEDSAVAAKEVLVGKLFHDRVLNVDFARSSLDR